MKQGGFGDAEENLYRFSGGGSVGGLPQLFVCVEFCVHLGVVASVPSLRTTPSAARLGTGIWQVIDVRVCHRYLFKSLFFFWIGQGYSHYAISHEPEQPVWVSDRCQGLNVGLRTESSSHLPHALSLARRLRLPRAKPAHGDKGVQTNQPHGAGLGVLFRNLGRGL